MAALWLGSDTVELVFRDPVLDGFDNPEYDPDNRPETVDRVVEKSGVKFTITGVTESDDVTVYQAKCALPVDADTTALASKDAIRHDGLLFEMSGEARVKRTLIDGVAHHVRAVCSREASAGRGELVTVTPRGGQDDDGARLPDGAPFTVLALAVDPGNTAARYGAAGTVVEADFTVVLPLHCGVSDGDWITVRGRTCVAALQREFSQHAARDRDVVLARFRSGGY